jgi:hypothetical protein
VLPRPIRYLGTRLEAELSALRAASLDASVADEPNRERALAVLDQADLARQDRGLGRRFPGIKINDRYAAPENSERDKLSIFDKSRLSEHTSRLGPQKTANAYADRQDSQLTNRIGARRSRYSAISVAVLPERRSETLRK